MIKNSVYLTLYLVTEICNYLLAYSIIFQAGITRNKKRITLGIAAIFLIHFTIFFYRGLEISETCSVLTMVLLPILALEKRETKYFIIYPFIIMGITNVIIGFTYLFSVIFSMSEVSVAQDGQFGLLCQCIPIFLMLALVAVRRHGKKEQFHVQLGWQQYILFYIGAFCSFLLLTAMQVLSSGDISKEAVNACGLACSLSSIVFMILILWQGIVVYRENHYKERCKVNERYMELQAEHFRQLMKQDKKMRKFRHDMDSHMTILKHLCEEGEKQEMEKYLSKILQESAVEEVAACTGNRGVDAVIGPLGQEALEKNISMEWKGILPGKTKVDLYDLCTVVSNLFKNAIEACEKISQENERKIEVSMGSYNDFIYLRIRNTVGEEVEIRDQKLPTSKSDKDHHGIGSENVAEAVAKYDGEVSYCCKDGWFEAEVMM